MNQKASSQGSPWLDKFLWTLFGALLICGVAGNYYFSDQLVIYRVIALLIVFGCAAFVAYKTVKGRQFWDFALAAKMETRKVVWPTRAETMQTTALVMGMVVITGLILWGVDALLLKIVAWITGYGAV